MRLDKFLADSGIGTRSEVKNYIKKNRVSVNGLKEIKPDTKVEPQTDEIMFDGVLITEKIGHKYYVLNKPAGVITATMDKEKKTVFDLLSDSDKKGLFAIGRLDKDTEGLLLLTNDGNFDHALMSPKKHVSKKYFARLSDECPLSLIDEFRNGLDIGDEKPLKPAELIILDDKKEIYVTISEGRYHQVKRMFGKFGLKVEYLKRVSIGAFNLPDDLKVSNYRVMTEEERALCLK